MATSSGSPRRACRTGYRVLAVLLAAPLAGGCESAVAPTGDDPVEVGPLFADSLVLPLAMGETWYVCQGYFGSLTHQNLHALDLTIAAQGVGPHGCRLHTAEASAGRSVFAPADGVAVHGPAPDFVFLDFDAGGRIVIGHLEPESRASGPVRRGDHVGVLAGPNDRNGRYSHIHIQMHLTLGGPTVPFAESHGTRFIDGPDLPDLGVTNLYQGVILEGGQGTLAAQLAGGRE